MSGPMRSVFDPQTVLGDISQLQQVVGVTSGSGLQQDVSDVSGRVQANEQAIEVIDASLGFHYNLVTTNIADISDVSGRVQANEQAIEVIDASLGFHYNLVTTNIADISDVSGRVQLNQEELKNKNSQQDTIINRLLLNAVLPTDTAQIAVTTFSVHNSDGTPKQISKELEVTFNEASNQVLQTLALNGMFGTVALTLSAGDSTGKGFYIGDSPTTINVVRTFQFAAQPLAYFAVRDQLKNGSIPGITWDGKYAPWPAIPGEYDILPFGFKAEQKDRTGVEPTRVDANNPIPTFDPYTFSWVNPENFIESFNEFNEFRSSFLSGANNKKYEHGFTVYSRREAKTTNGDYNRELDATSEAFLLSAGVFTPEMTTEQKEAIWATLDFYPFIYQHYDLGLVTAPSVPVSNVTKIPSDAIDQFLYVLKFI